MNFTDRLKKNDDFRAVYKKGRSCANHEFVVYALSNGTERSRFGVSVSKKVGNSVVRHRVKRLVKENYRLREEMFVPGTDIVVVARAAAVGADFDRVGGSLLHLAKRLHIIKPMESVK